MRPGQTYALAVVALGLLVFGLLAAVGLAIGAALAPADRAALARVAAANANLLIFAGLVLAGGLAAAVHLFFRAYVYPAAVLADATALVASVNPGHRIAPRGAPEIRRIGQHVAALAERIQALERDVDARIRAANVDVEAERNRLAALMADLAQSVVVCNAEGRILLYNASARQLFGQAPADQPLSGGLVGLGRSIFGIFDRSLIVHALDTIDRRTKQGDPGPVAHVVTTTAGGQLIRGHLAPIRGEQGTIDGFVLTVDDVTRLVESANRREALLQSLLERVRSSLGNIRAAVETAVDYPTMSAERRARLMQIIQEEAAGLSAEIDQTQSAHAESVGASWPMEEMLARDLLAVVQLQIASRLGLSAQVAPPDDDLWLNVDSFAIAQALTAIAGWLCGQFHVAELALGAWPSGRGAGLDVRWHGPPIDSGTLGIWREQPLSGGLGGTAPTLGDVVARHSAEIWSGSDAQTGGAYIRLLLPATRPDIGWSAPVLEASRPEYYDFDLFHQPGQRPELDQTPLAELTYTVFDTETTGLAPSQGDEIISIGAVRIVNGRLLRHEIFDQLVDPRRPISEESIRIHGLTPRVLRGQPTIDIVLPRFAQFAEDTVLVAHNAAFDMRFFQLKQAQTGVALAQPVLDTLLLSQVTHPNEDAHSLEALARRLGVNITGRHTALGDAIVTGEVLLKLIPLLVAQGIRTLGEARGAAERTLYARVRY